MGLLNYSTTIDVAKTTGEIMGTLAKQGAKEITIGYDDNGNPMSISFYIKTKYGDRDFRLPANIDAIWRVLTKQYQAGKVQRRFTTREQAARVGWRIVKDWLDAQLALIEAEMATLDEIMLPYLLAEPDKTLYQLYNEKGLKMLPMGREGNGTEV